MPPSHIFGARSEHPENGSSALSNLPPLSSVRDPRITPATPPAPSAISSTTPLYVARANCPRSRQYESIPPPRACSDSPDATCADNTPFTAPPRSKLQMSAPYRMVHLACISQNAHIYGYDVPKTLLVRQRDGIGIVGNARSRKQPALRSTTRAPLCPHSWSWIYARCMRLNVLCDSRSRRTRPSRGTILGWLAVPNRPRPLWRHETSIYD